MVSSLRPARLGAALALLALFLQAASAQGFGGGSGGFGGFGSGNGNGGFGGFDGFDYFRNLQRLVLPHGVLMLVVWVILYPLGAALQPVLLKWYIHAAWQTIAFLAMWAGFAIGYVLARDGRMLFNNTHTVLGTAVCALMCLQPILGWMHHRHFVQYRGRGLVSYAHIWYGRALMAIGIINGGLGISLARAPNGIMVAYIVLAVILTVIYVAAAVLGQARRWRRQRAERLEGKQRSVPVSSA